MRSHELCSPKHPPYPNLEPNITNSKPNPYRCPTANSSEIRPAQAGRIEPRKTFPTRTNFQHKNHEYSLTMHSSRI